ncbi:MAG: hypothetical protein K2Y28_00480 [Burkholderiaceae bacterium]|nr:hypothetical protein [Burkholderiaceae bacterium]
MEPSGSIFFASRSAFTMSLGSRYQGDAPQESGYANLFGIPSAEPIALD